ncbi:hypothetical protein OG754_39270 [Streptomyces decoyicus]|uniref:hypothetical protein n=1 Tax=Streptomyces decoyicus TaxID=249567 RepID=UPI002E3030E6|nr:hypothetical protein [Streptomyces decoyicus]
MTRTLASAHPWPRLVTVIDERGHTVTPACSHSPAFALYLAHCTRCGAAYTGPWKLLAFASRAA